MMGGICGSGSGDGAGGRRNIRPSRTFIRKTFSFRLCSFVGDFSNGYCFEDMNLIDHRSQPGQGPDHRFEAPHHPGLRALRLALSLVVWCTGVRIGA